MNNHFDYYIMKDLDISSQIDFSRKVYSFLFLLNFEYPNFTRWYHSLYTNEGLLKKEREIILCKNGDNIAGVMILKNDENEKKICTLRVSPFYQGLGIGSTLIEKSFELFDNNKPLITIHISKYHEFKKLFDYYNFSLEQQIQGYYGLLRSELSYNGILCSKIIKTPSIIGKVAFGLEKAIYNYPTIKNTKVLMSNPLKQFNERLILNNTMTTKNQIIQI